MTRREPVIIAEYAYDVLFQPEPEGGYTVTCPTLPGLVSYGETPDEARAMAVEAIEAYLEALQKDGSCPHSFWLTPDRLPPALQRSIVRGHGSQ